MRAAPTGLAAGGLPEYLRIVGVDKAQIRFTQSPEFAQPLVIGLHPLPVEGNGAFHQAQRARRSAAAVELAVVIKAVTGMQNPAAAGIDRDGGVPTGAAGQIDQDDAVGDLGEFLGAGKPRHDSASAGACSTSTGPCACPAGRYHSFLDERLRDGAPRTPRQR